MICELVKRTSDGEDVKTFYKTDLSVENDDIPKLTAEIKKAISEPLQLMGQGLILLLYDGKTKNYTIMIKESEKVPYIHRLCQNFEV